MTADRRGELPRPFAPDELDGVPEIQPDELAAETRLGRDLESVAARSGAVPGAGFADRVMAAVAAEPLPAPGRAARAALRRGALLALLASIRDGWRVTFSGGFPVAARAQALALVLVAAGLVGGAGLATAGAIGLLEGDHAAPSPSLVKPSPSAVPTQVRQATSTPVPTEAAPTEEVSESPEPTPSEAADSERPRATEESGEDAGYGEAGNKGGDRTAAPTKRPQATPDPTPTPTPTDDEEDWGHWPRPTERPSPSPTPTPTPVPTPTSTPMPVATPTPTPTPRHGSH